MKAGLLIYTPLYSGVALLIYTPLYSGMGLLIYTPLYSKGWVYTPLYSRGSIYSSTCHFTLGVGLLYTPCYSEDGSTHLYAMLPYSSTCHVTLLIYMPCYYTHLHATLLRRAYSSTSLYAECGCAYLHVIFGRRCFPPNISISDFVQ